MTRASSILLVLVLLGCVFGAAPGCASLRDLARDAASAAVSEAKPALLEAADRARADALDRAEKLAREAKEEAKAFAKGLAEEGLERARAAATVAAGAAAEKVASSAEAKAADWERARRELELRMGAEGGGDASDLIKWLLLTSGVGVATTGAAELRKVVRDARGARAPPTAA